MSNKGNQSLFRVFLASVIIAALISLLLLEASRTETIKRTREATRVPQLQIHPNDRKSLIAAGCFVDPVATAPEFSDEPLDESSEDAWNNVVNSCRIEPQSTCPIPNVYHGVMFDYKKFSLHQYVALKSIHDIVQPFAMYLHGSHFPLRDPLFKKALREFNLKLVSSRNGSSIFRIATKFIQHRSDVIRMEALIKYGGFYSDLDVFFLQPLHNLSAEGFARASDTNVFTAKESFLTEYEMVMGKETETRICNGIIMAKRCAHFMREWYKQYVQYRNNDWGFTSLDVPMMLWKNMYQPNPQLRTAFHLDESQLQQPTFGKKEWTQTEAGYAMWNFSKNVAVHLWKGHDFTNDIKQLKRADAPMHRIARYILWGNKSSPFDQDDDYRRS